MDRKQGLAGKQDMTGNHIFKYISRQDLEEMLTAFHMVTKLNVMLIENDGTEILTRGKRYAFCRMYVMSRDFGESYVFSCHSGLHHIVYPVMIKGKQFGSMLAGPFLMEEPDESFVRAMEVKRRLTELHVNAFLRTLLDIPVFEPQDITVISSLFRYLMRSILVESREIIDANNQKLLQQSRINESIQMYKNSGYREVKNYPIELENELLSCIRDNKREKSREILNTLLGHILLYEGHNVYTIKYRIVELCSLLSRASISRGADPNVILDLNQKLISSVMESHTVYDLCYRLQDNIEIFTDNLFEPPEKNSRVVRNTVEYISQHFSEEISLAGVAEELHINASYLSMLFRQVTGVTFKEHLNRVRVEEAERLLKNTDYPIIEIAVACGYRDQSYFTKVFKKYTGLTPRQYR